MKKYISEMIGTMVLVLMGCGCAIFNGGCGTTAQVLTVAFANSSVFSKNKIYFLSVIGWWYNPVFYTEVLYCLVDIGSFQVSG